MMLPVAEYEREKGREEREKKPQREYNGQVRGSKKKARGREGRTNVIGKSNGHG